MSKRKNTAAKKSGPITIEGRAKSALNAIKHGLYSSKIVLSHESKEEFAALHAELMLEFDPTTPAQAHQVDQIAASQWRLQRIWRNDCNFFELTMDLHHDRIEAGIADADTKLKSLEAVTYDDLAKATTQDRMLNHEVRLTNIIARAVRTLDRLKTYESRKILATNDNGHGPGCKPGVKSSPNPPEQNPQPLPFPSLTEKKRNEPILDENPFVQSLAERVKELLDTENIQLPGQIHS